MRRARLPDARAAFTADGLATAAGAVFGTSSTTSYIESSAGIEEGGKTGITAIVVAGFFLASLFFWPLAGAIPAVATAPALIVMGAAMMFSCRAIAWSDFRIAVPGLFTILGMPLTYSITNGISLGIISYCCIHWCSGQARKVHWLLAVICLLLVARFIFLEGG